MKWKPHITEYNKIYSSYYNYWNDVWNYKIKFNSKNNTHELPWDIKTHDLNLEEILNYYNLNGGKVFELGCGSGYDAAYLSKRGFDVTAIDISDEAVRIAKENTLHLNVKFVVEDFFNYTTEEKFDVVYDRCFLHNLKDRLKVIFEKVSGLLELGGKFIAITGNQHQPKIQCPTPTAVNLSEIEYYSAEWFKIILAEEIVYQTREEFEDCLGYIYVLEKKINDR